MHLASDELPEQRLLVNKREGSHNTFLPCLTFPNPMTMVTMFYILLLLLSLHIIAFIGLASQATANFTQSRWVFTENLCYAFVWNWWG